MKHYAKFGYKNFIIATGYKHKYIKDYFEKNNFGWNIEIINRINSMTGGRIKRLKKKLNNKKFF